MKKYTFVDLFAEIGIDSSLSLTAYITCISPILNGPFLTQLMDLGSITFGGTILRGEDLTNALQVCSDSETKKILFPTSSAGDITIVLAEMVAKFQISFRHHQRTQL